MVTKQLKYQQFSLMKSWFISLPDQRPYSLQRIAVKRGNAAIYSQTAWPMFKSSVERCLFIRCMRSSATRSEWARSGWGHRAYPPGRPPCRPQSSCRTHAADGVEALTEARQDLGSWDVDLWVGPGISRRLMLRLRDFWARVPSGGV